MQTDTPEVGSPSPTPVESTPTRSRQLPQRSAKGSGGGGIGIAIVIAIVLFRGMPRLWKMLNNKDRDKPVPVEIREEDLRVLQDALRPANDGPAKHGPGNDGQGQDQEGGLLNPDETDHKLDDRPLDNASDDSVDFEP